MRPSRRTGVEPSELPVPKGTQVSMRAECSAMFLVMCGPFRIFPGIQGQL
jgi:hypothetical protein